MDASFKLLAEITIRSAKNLPKLGLSSFPNPYTYPPPNKASHSYQTLNKSQASALPIATQHGTTKPHYSQHHNNKSLYYTSSIVIQMM